MKKAGVVAAGALATVAVMGAPAAAAPAPQADASAFTKATALNLMRGNGSMPWDTHRQPLLAAGTGSKGSALAWQICGSAAMAGIGGTVDTDPNTVMGSNGAACNNANALLDGEEIPAVLGALNDTYVALAPWQACGSTTMGGIGGTVAVMAPNTVFGSCRNANVVILPPTNGGKYEESTTVQEAAAKPIAATRQGKQQVTDTRKATTKGTAADDTAKLRTALASTDSKAKVDNVNNGNGYNAKVGNLNNGNGYNDAKAGKPAAPKVGTDLAREMNPWEVEPMGVLSVGTGSVATGAPWQLCAGQAVWGVGGVVGATSPNTVFGDCDNNNVWIDQPEEWQHLISILDYTHLSALSWQVCGSDVVAGVGGSVSVQSPDTVFGSCNNDNTVIH